MPTNSKKSAQKAPKKTASQQKTETMPWYRRIATASRVRIDAFLERRPHRSFRRTRRRDYIRSLELPKVSSFTLEVTRTLWRQRKIFFPLMIIYLVLYVILVGLGSQDTYTQLADSLKGSSDSLFSGSWGAVSQSAVTLIALATSGLNPNPTDAQQIFGVLLGLMVWLTTVWLLRNILAGHKVKLRDGLYNAGAPIIASIVVVLVMAVQLLPIAIAAIGYSAASASGLLTSGVEAMLFWAAAGLLALLSLYWITSTLFALVIVTLPGMYPFRAIRVAGDIMIGRRVKILLRWLWMLLCIVILWVVIMIPLILLAMWLTSLWPQLSWLPIVPVGLLVVSTYSIFWISTYVYLLYRKVVDNESV